MATRLTQTGAQVQEVLDSALEMPLVKGGGTRSVTLKDSGSSATATNSFAIGSNTKASGINAHAEGYNTKASGANAHAEGSSTEAYGDKAHAEGSCTVAKNAYEHAEGCYNKSNDGSDAASKTVHSVGIGNSNLNRKNAHEIMRDGKHFVIGLGGYDGTNAVDAGVYDLATIVRYLLNPIILTEGDLIPDFWRPQWPGMYRLVYNGQMYQPTSGDTNGLYVDIGDLSLSVTYEPYMGDYLLWQTL